MFKFLASLAMVFCLCVTSGCAGMKNDTYVVSPELEHFQHPFMVTHGEHGAVKTFPAKSSVEKYANLDLLLLEPGFIAYIECSHASELEDVFKKQGYVLKDSKKAAKDICQLNFARQGEMVFFVD